MVFEAFYIEIFQPKKCVMVLYQGYFLLVPAPAPVRRSEVPAPANFKAPAHPQYIHTISSKENHWAVASTTYTIYT